MRKRTKNNCLRSNKKSQATSESLFVLTEIILVVAAVFLIFGKITSIENDQLFLKKYYSRDIALLLDEIQGMQGNIFYQYNPPQTTLEKLDFTFSPTQIQVADEKYLVAARDLQESKIEKPKKIFDSKEGNKIILQKEQPKPLNANKISCPRIDLTLGKIIIDPGHGYDFTDETGDTGFKTEKLQESILIANLAASLQSALKVTGIYADTTRSTQINPTEESKTTEERKKLTEQHTTIISLHANQDEPTTNNIKAYVNYNSKKYYESVKLACEILNAISDTFVKETTGIAIIPIDTNQLSEDNPSTILDESDPKLILDDKKIAVQIEVGNLNTKNSFTPQKNTQLAIAISQAIESTEK